VYLVAAESRADLAFKRNKQGGICGFKYNVEPPADVVAFRCLVVTLLFKVLLRVNRDCVGIASEKIQLTELEKSLAKSERLTQTPDQRFRAEIFEWISIFALGIRRQPQKEIVSIFTGSKHFGFQQKTADHHPVFCALFYAPIQRSSNHFVFGPHVIPRFYQTTG
jgi:hypothetical protein